MLSVQTLNRQILKRLALSNMYRVLMLPSGSRNKKTSKVAKLKEKKKYKKLHKMEQLQHKQKNAREHLTGPADPNLVLVL